VIQHVSRYTETPIEVIRTDRNYEAVHVRMLAMYLCRNLQIRAMGSESFDGEYASRVMENFGFIRVRGSSSRGGVRALLGMRRTLEQGWTG
jgi:lysophospholipid acyltransferase (LPLAT)-like uncharacterized protein